MAMGLSHAFETRYRQRSLQAVQFMRTKASGHPSWPGVTDSTEGRIHWRRPTAIHRFSLATLRRTIHDDKAVSQDLKHSGTGPVFSVSNTPGFTSQSVENVTRGREWEDTMRSVRCLALMILI